MYGSRATAKVNRPYPLDPLASTVSVAEDIQLEDRFFDDLLDEAVAVRSMS